MSAKNPVIAIACADIHLYERPPIARCSEPDWFAAMARPLNEMDKLASELRVPILCAGDLFHHWKASPELINFAIDNLPYMIAIPGQHDLPNHAYSDINRSAYGTLVRAGKIANVRPGKPYYVGTTLAIHGAPWGSPVKNTLVVTGKTNILLQHAYRWIPGANPAQADIMKYSPDEYTGFQTVIIGDNHTSWDKGNVFNCGSLMRRNADQKNHRPRVGLIHADGTVLSHFLDCSLDMLVSNPLMKEMENKDCSIAIGNLIKELGELQTVALDFPEAMLRAMDQQIVSDSVRKMIMEAMNGMRS